MSAEELRTILDRFSRSLQKRENPDYICQDQPTSATSVFDSVDLKAALTLLNMAAEELNSLPERHARDLNLAHRIIEQLSEQIRAYENEHEQLHSTLERAESLLRAFWQRLELAETELVQLKSAISTKLLQP